jgi:hypothetical protein
MKKTAFPYSRVTRAYYFDIHSPLGEYARLHGDYFLGPQDSPNHGKPELGQDAVSSGLELLVNEMAVSLNIAVVGLERFMNQLDRAMCGELDGKHGIKWPSTKTRFPAVPNSKPFGFYYYNIRAVLKHWGRIFGNTIKNKNTKKISDCIQFRHIWSHNAGFVDSDSAKKFKFFRVHKNSFLTPGYSGYKDLYTSTWRFAHDINETMGALVLKRLRQTTFTKSWKKDKGLFMSVLRCFSWFGAMKQDLKLAKGLYEMVLVGKYNFSSIFEPPVQ